MATTTLAIVCLAAAAAETGGAAVWLTVGQWVFNALAAGFGWWIKRRVENTDKLEERVSKQAEQLIDAKIGALTKDIDTIVQRLERGDKEFRGLGDRDHQIRLEIRGLIDTLKDYIRDTCPSKEDMRVLSKKVDRLSVTVARIEGARS